MFAGTFINAHDPGAPPVWFVAGREMYSVVIFDYTEDGVPIFEIVDLLEASGIDSGSPLGICTALAE